MIKKILGGFCLLCMSFALQAKVLDVVLDKARLVNLPHNAKSIFISSNEVADYQALTNTKIMVFGKKRPGQYHYMFSMQVKMLFTLPLSR